MQIIEKKIDELKPYEKNPRKNDEAVEYVANSIKEFGFKVPIIIDKDNVIVAGHTRYRAAQKLKINIVPCIIADDLTDEKIKAFRLADNKVGEFAEWDVDLLDGELEGIFDIDMGAFGFSSVGEEDNEENDEDNPYTMAVNVPQYEITGDCPSLDELVDNSKESELIEEIEASNVSDEEKAFLIQAARRHNVFNYRNIAEYYAHASKEMQELMEKSALVIIDFENAIRDGFAELRNDILNLEVGELVGGDYDEE